MTQITIRLGEIAIEDRQIVLPDSVEAATRPYLGLEQIEAQTGRILSYTTSSIDGKSNTFAFDSSHVLYGKLRPYLNKVATPDRCGRCSTEIIPLVPHGVNRDYLALLLRTERIISSVMSEKTGSRMPRADMKNLFDIETSITSSKCEQRQIATLLKAQLAEVEKARLAAQAQLRDTHLLQSSILNTIFSDLDSAPRRKIDDAAETTSGSTPSRGQKSYWDPAEIPWVKTAEVAFTPINQTEESISKTALAECSLKLLPPNTVLIAMYGQGKTRGQSAILKIEATTNQACFAILPNETWEPEFLYLWIKKSYQDLRTLSEDRGGNQANLSGALLKAFKVPAPAISVQKRVLQKATKALKEVESLTGATRTVLVDIHKLPSRILARAFEL